MQFDFPKLKPTFTLSEQERSAYTISDRPNIVDWCQKNIRLTKGYTQPGAFVARPWQIEPLNWIHEWNNIYFLGPTQTGKSTMADMFIAYAMGVYRVNGIFRRGDGPDCF
jgi:phage terminase large subunit GpA-like protein